MDSQRDNLLVLKVMRLTRPTFHQSSPFITCDHRDGFKEAFDNLNTFPGFTKLAEFSSFNQTLTLPQNFCNIFLGEVFTGHINVNNDSDQTCSDVTVKIDLQTMSQRCCISTPPSGFHRAELKAGAGMNEVINHEVKELGAHILVCVVSYNNAFNEKMLYRKLFKFQVLKPLDVKTKFHSSDSDYLYVEAQIQNITNNPIYLQKVSLEAAEPFSVEHLNTCIGSEEEEDDDGGGDFDGVGNNNNKNNKNAIISIFHPLLFLNSHDTRQYLYKLSPKNNNNNNDDTNNANNNADVKELPSPTPFLTKGVSSVGKLDIVWTSSMGERGRLQTSQLHKMFPGSGDLNVRVVECSGQVSEGVVEELLLCVSNCCDRDMDLSLRLHSNHHKGFLWSGICAQHLGSVQRGTSILVRLHYLTTSTGLITLSGVHLTDSLMRRTYEHDDVTQVLSIEGVVVGGEEG